ncbi:MAG: gamma-glutamyltransferase family protein [Actinomycetota bacterium]|nr:gamma-glutamyltransferase family protein [Actinomycetota bacterium]
MQNPFTTRPELRGTFGMVASTHWLASASGMAVLEAGGNAFDAAVAAGFVLQVVEPHLNGPGGEAPIVAYSARRGEPLVVNGQGPAPAAASIAHFSELGLDLVPGTGLLPACVPGAFDAWMSLLLHFGTFRLGDVMKYAIGYARNGYPVVADITEAVAGVRRLFETEWPDSGALYLKSGAAPRPGTLLKNEALAATYERIVVQSQAITDDREAQIEAARHAYYEGFVAQAIDAYCTGRQVMDSTGARHSGLLTGEDMARWKASIEAPVTLDYHGYTVCKTGPWGQGPVFLQGLSLLDGFDLAAMDDIELIHTVVECAKLAFADREAWYGDPAFTDVPLAGLLDEDYAAARQTLVGDEASRELRPGSVDGRPPRLPPERLWRADGSNATAEPSIVPSPGRSVAPPSRSVAPPLDRPGDTCHLDVADRLGNLVSATPSGGWLQSSPVIPELGFPLGTRAQMFWLVDGLPNSLEGGKRPRTTLTPSLALRDGDPYLAWGTPGGDQQDQWTLPFFLRHVLRHESLQAAIDAPTWHTEHVPSSFYPRTANLNRLVIENGFGPGVIEGLRARGHVVIVSDRWSLGRLSAAGRDGAGVLKAAANPRGMQGYAAGR